MPIILVGNKADKANEREVGKDEGIACARKMDCEFVETSAKTRLNVEAAYFNLIRSVLHPLPFSSLCPTLRSCGLPMLTI